MCWHALSLVMLLRGSKLSHGFGFEFDRILVNSYSSDWFRLETVDDSLQPTIDMILNLSVFMWLGAVCPWPMFLDNSVISIYRLLALGVLVLLFRRLPIIFITHRYIHQIEGIRHAAFVGFFGTEQPLNLSFSAFRRQGKL